MAGSASSASATSKTRSTSRGLGHQVRPPRQRGEHRQDQRGRGQRRHRVQPAHHRHQGGVEADLLVRLAQRRRRRVLALVEPPAREADLSLVGAQARRAPGEDQPGLAVLLEERGQDAGVDLIDGGRGGLVDDGGAPNIASPPTSSGTGPRWPGGLEGARARGRCRCRCAAPREVRPGRRGARAARWPGVGSPGAEPGGTSSARYRRSRPLGRTRPTHPDASLRSRADDVTPESCRRRPTRSGGTTPSTWATGSSRRATASRRPGPGSSPTSPAAASSTSGPGTASTPSRPSRRAPPVSSRSTTTPGASTSSPGAPTGPSASSTARCPTSRATRRTSGGPTCRGGAGFELAKAALGVEGRAGGGRLPEGRPRRARPVRRRALSRRAVPHEGATDLPRAAARRHQGGRGHRDGGGAPPGSRPRGAAPVPRRQLAAHRLRQLVRADHRGAAQPVPGGRLLRGAHHRRAATRTGRSPPPRCTVRSGGGSPASPAVPSAPTANYRAVVHAIA